MKVYVEIMAFIIFLSIIMFTLGMLSMQPLINKLYKKIIEYKELLETREEQLSGSKSKNKNI